MSLGGVFQTVLEEPLSQTKGEPSVSRVFWQNQAILCFAKKQIPRPQDAYLPNVSVLQEGASTSESEGKAHGMLPVLQQPIFGKGIRNLKK